MNPIEFRHQIFRDAEQWKHGLGSTLQPLDGGGFALFSRPGFTEWVSREDAARCVGSIAVDACGRVFWIHRHDCHLYRLDPGSGLVESIIPLAHRGAADGCLFGRIASVPGRLWIHDRGGARVIALRSDTFQIIVEIPVPTGTIDVAVGANRVFTLQRDVIHSYDAESGRALDSISSDALARPAAMGVDPQGAYLYVADLDAGAFLRFKLDGRCHDEIGRFDDVFAGFRPRLLDVHPDGSLFVSDGSSVAHEFAPDGGYVGDTGKVNPLSAILSMAFDADGHLYVGSPAGIARLGRETGIAGKSGTFYGGTLDNGGEPDVVWHRVDLVAQLADGGALDLYYASSADQGLVDLVDGVLAGESSTAEKARALDKALGDLWVGPQEIRAVSDDSASAEDPVGDFGRYPTHSALFRPDTRRYLWLKLVVSGLAPGATASVREIRVYYPRLSYLRYLPAVYQEDKPSREFLERFLSMFETVFSGLESAIERVPELFDPSKTPAEFLDWLAEWLDLGIEEDWSPEIKRRLIRSAPRLYARKGTPAGLAEFIRIVTGREPVIRESFDVERPPTLGDDTRLGVETHLFSQPVEALPADRFFRLGGGSALGTSRLLTDTTRPIDPFRAAAHKFSVMLDLSPQQFERYARGLHRVIREQSPAHVGYEIHLTAGSGLGPDTVVGVNCRVEDPQRFCLGHSLLGRSVCLRSVWHGPEVGHDATLRAFPYGEQ